VQKTSANWGLRVCGLEKVLYLLVYFFVAHLGSIGTLGLKTERYSIRYAQREYCPLEQMLAQSPLKFGVVRPYVCTENPRTCEYLLLADYSVHEGGRTTGRARTGYTGGALSLRLEWYPTLDWPRGGGAL
jgi:hypothetical protein